MSGYWLDIALIALLVLLNAAFAGSEMALVSLREGQLRQLEVSDKPREQRLARLARDPNRFLATIQVGITLAGFLASATAAVSLAEPLFPHVTWLGSAAQPVVVTVITLVLAFVTLVFGELVPKRIAMQRALTWALVAARPLDLLATLARPLVALLGASTAVVVRLLGGRPGTTVEEISPDELRALVSTSHELDDEQRDIISGALELQHRLLRHVLVPRGSVVAVPAETTVAEARSLLAGAGHSRAPVTRGKGLDDVLGVVHWAALVDGDDEPVSRRALPALVLPETVPVLDALARFREERQQLALVVDEHGSVEGIVTLEDLLEEIVGEIWDETDLAVAGATRESDGSVELPGTYPVHDLPDVGVELGLSPSADYTTVAGLVLKLLGRIPEAPGDVVCVDGWEIEVLAVAHHAVTQVRLRPLAT